MDVTSDRAAKYQADSLSLIGAIALGTGVMIGAGIFALTGQMAEMTGSLFPLAFLSAALIVSLSAYSYVKLSNAYPSAGGIAMYLEKAYGGTLTTAFHALLMYFSMVIAQSFLARTFGSYALQLFEIDADSWLVPALGVGLLLMAFLINLSVTGLVQGGGLVARVHQDRRNRPVRRGRRVGGGLGDDGFLRGRQRGVADRFSRCYGARHSGLQRFHHHHQQRFGT